MMIMRFVFFIIMCLATTGKATSATNDKFAEAVAYVNGLPPNDGKVTPKEILTFYANYKQATVGPCSQSGVSQPGLSEPTKRMKWNAWNSLEKKSKEDAMRDYVQLLDDTKKRLIK